MPIVFETLSSKRLVATRARFLIVFLRGEISSSLNLTSAFIFQLEISRLSTRLSNPRSNPESFSPICLLLVYPIKGET